MQLWRAKVQMFSQSLRRQDCRGRVWWEDYLSMVQVVHCVMYPRMEYDLPILSFDMVGKDDRVSLVCIDPCPVAMDRSLPPVYVSLVRCVLSSL